MDLNTNSTLNIPVVTNNHDAWYIVSHYDGSNTKLNIVVVIGFIVLLSLLCAFCRLAMYVRKRRSQSVDYKYSAVNTISVEHDLECDDLNDNDNNDIEESISQQRILNNEGNNNNNSSSSSSNDNYDTDCGTKKDTNPDSDYYKLLNLTPKYDIFAKTDEGESESGGDIEMNPMGDTEVIDTLVENTPNSDDANAAEKSYINTNSGW